MSNLDMKEAIKLLAQEKNISEDTLLQVLVDALATAYKKRPGAAEEVEVMLNPDTLEMSFIAYDIDEDGNWVNERDDTPSKNELGRIAAQTFRQVMGQRIREAERDRKFEEYANREGDIVTGIVQQNDHRYALLDLGKVEALMPQSEQVPYEKGYQLLQFMCNLVGNSAWKNFITYYIENNSLQSISAFDMQRTWSNWV